MTMSLYFSILLFKIKYNRIANDNRANKRVEGQSRGLEEVPLTTMPRKSR